MEETTPPVTKIIFCITSTPLFTGLSSFLINDLKIKTIAIIDDKTTYTQGLADNLEKALGDKVKVRLIHPLAGKTIHIQAKVLSVTDGPDLLEEDHRVVALGLLDPLELDEAPVLVVGSAGALARDHRGPQRLARRALHPEGRALVGLDQTLQDLAGATDLLLNAKTLAEETGDEVGLAEYHMNACLVASLAGKIGEAVAHDEATVELGEKSGVNAIFLSGLCSSSLFAQKWAEKLFKVKKA